MAKIIEGSALASDPETLAVEAAEADFILSVQCEIQKILNDKGVSARNLSKRLKVTEARVSQMFGDQAKNLTIKTVARIFYHLGETAYVTTQEEFDRAISRAKGEQVLGDQRWTVSCVVSDIEATSNIPVDRSQTNVVGLPSARFLDRWARAEKAEALKSRRIATAL